jgi:serine/threonine protein kinase
MLREQSILRKRKEQKEQQQLLHRTNGSIPAPPNFPSLDGFLESPTEQSKSHTGRRNSINSKTSNDAPSTGNPEVYQLPTLEERLDIAHQIALGMQHLHAHGIVFRDLKPHNVGLSVTYNNDNNITNISNLDLTNSTVPQPHLTWRLFDFGLARELPRNQVGGGVCYGKAGSLRYMAPETMGGRWLRSSKHQNSSCFATLQSDVYAFAILLWELVGLQNFDKRYDANPEEFESAVCDRGHRPTMEALDAAIERDVGPLPSAAAEAARKYRHSNIRELVHACWREDYRHRPDFDFVVSTLKEMLTSEIENDQLDENENDPDDDNTVATDNLNESEMDLASFRSHQKPHSSQRIMNIQQIPSSMGSLGGQPLNRLSGHSYTSGSGRNRHRMLFRKPSHRSMSSRSMLSAHSVSTHSMVLEDVFEIDTEHSNSDKSSNRSSTKKSRDASLDDEDVDEDDFDDDESMANASLMNESVITISNRQKSSSRYLEYCADEGIEEEDEEDEDADDELEEEGDDGPPRVMHLAMNSVRERRGANGRGETTRYPPPLRGASSGSELTLYSTESSVDNRKNNRKNNRKS